MVNLWEMNESLRLKDQNLKLQNCDTKQVITRFKFSKQNNIKSHMLDSELILSNVTKEKIFY